MAGTTVAESFIPRSSSNVAQADYDPDTETLTITFTDYSVYDYFNVPQAVYSGLTAAGSVGSYVARQIKGRYAYDRQ